MFDDQFVEKNGDFDFVGAMDYIFSLVDVSVRIHGSILIEFNVDLDYDENKHLVCIKFDGFSMVLDENFENDNDWNTFFKLVENFDFSEDIKDKIKQFMSLVKMNGACEISILGNADVNHFHQLLERLEQAGCKLEYSNSNSLKVEYGHENLENLRNGHVKRIGTRM